MDADTGNGGLRPKRCLPAEFHPGTAHQNPPRTNRPESFSADSRSKASPSRGNHSHRPTQLNSRFFTDYYPVSAVFEPKVHQITPPPETIWIPSLNHKADN